MNPSGFASTLADVLREQAPTFSSKDRAVELARSVLARGGDMMLTAPEAALVSRELLSALGLRETQT